mmetsp:Transcript_5683/g.10207  ORF Transcript_5683/g.10207 Transcript_5683/m.10207 type:complete len:167 (-) Transcript_5683:141-641(-)
MAQRRAVPAALVGIALIFTSMLLLTTSEAKTTSGGQIGKNQKHGRTRSPKPKPKTEFQCSTSCYEENCDNFGIRYGRFCGVSNTGCKGVKPCDDVDGCCEHHDECVGKQGVMAAKCHSVFIECINRHLKAGKRGFSSTCPYEQVVPVMESGIQLTMALTGGLRSEL